MLNAFVDESGDDGLSQTSSQWLILGCHILKESEANPVKTVIADGVKKIWPQSPPDHVHFVKCNHQRKKALLNLARGINCTCVVVGAHKGSFSPETLRGLKCPTLYNYVAKYLVERITWFAEGCNDQVRITFGERNQISFAQLEGYFCYLRTLEFPVHSIKFERIASMRCSPANSNSLVQAADWITSGFAAGLNPDQYGQIELSYTEILWGKFWSKGGKLWNYGIKVIPSSFDMKSEKLFRRVNTWLEDPTTLG